MGIFSGGGGGGGSTVGGSLLVYRKTVAGADVASIDTGVDAPDAGSNDWTNCDVLEFFLYARTDEAAALSEVKWQFNNVSTATYDWQWIRQLNTTLNGSIGLAANFIDTQVSGANVADTLVFGQVALQMANPTGTTNYKDVTGTGSVKIPGDAGNTASFLITGQARNANAITRLAVTPVTAAKKLKVGSQLTIYKRRS